MLLILAHFIKIINNWFSLFSLVIFNYYTDEKKHLEMTSTVIQQLCMEHFPKLSHLQSFPAPYQELVADGVTRARAAAANSNISWGQMKEGEYEKQHGENCTVIGRIAK